MMVAYLWFTFSQPVRLTGPVNVKTPTCYLPKRSYFINNSEFSTTNDYLGSGVIEVQVGEASKWHKFVRVDFLVEIHGAINCSPGLGWTTIVGRCPTFNSSIACLIPQQSLWQATLPQARKISVSEAFLKLNVPGAYHFHRKVRGEYRAVQVFPTHPSRCFD
jgi:hypothetical protein